MTNSYFYKAYGLNIESSIHFPELMHGKSISDVKIYFERYKPLKKLENNGFNEIFYNSNDVLYLFNNIPLFRVRSGKEIIVNPETNIGMVYLRHLILGPGMGTLLRQRGYLVLHASAVNIGGGAVVFLGWGGDGKSTIAAAMNNKGYQFITDDILILKYVENREILAIPSFPRVKLWDDTIHYFTDHPESVLKIHPQIKKYSYNVDNTFSLEPIPLKMIYNLEKSEQNQIVTLNPQDALIELIKSSFAVNQFGAGKSQNLFQCAKAVKKVPVKRLQKRSSLDDLEDLIRLVEEDVFNSFN